MSFTEQQARTEAARCRRNLANGGRPAFWLSRLDSAIRGVERTLAILRAARDATWDAHVKREAKETPCPW